MKLGRKMIYWILQHSFTNTWQKFSHLSLVWLCFVLFTPDHGLSVSVELFLWYFSRISKLGLVLLQRCKYMTFWVELNLICMNVLLNCVLQAESTICTFNEQYGFSQINKFFVSLVSWIQMLCVPYFPFDLQ